MLAMVILQATVATTEQTRSIDFDLKSIRISEACSSDSSSIDATEILVCGRRDANSRYRLKPLDTARYEPNRRAETTLVGNLKGAAETEQKELAPVHARLLLCGDDLTLNTR